MEVASWISN